MGKELILVVDDNRQMADATAESVSVALGYETLVSYGGRQALMVIREKHQDIGLLLTDMQMPGLSGLDLLRTLSEEGIHIPTILVTAHGSEHIAVEAFRLGVQDYLSKPMDPDELAEAIERALAITRLRREKERLSSQLREQISWLTALSNVGRSVTSTLNINTVLRRIVEAGVVLTRADQGFIAIFDEDSDQLFLRAVKNIDQGRIDTFRLPVTDELISEALSTGRPIRKSRAARKNLLKVTTGYLVHSLIHVPIIYQESRLGVLSINFHSQSRDFTEKDEAVLTSLADYAAIALQNASSYEQAQLEIEERKRVEIALRESEERYALAVRGANDGLWDWDLRTDYIYYSPRWKTMLGYAEDEIDDSPEEWFSRIYEEDIQHTKLDISAHVRRRTSFFSNEHRLAHKDGTHIWVLCRGIAVWNEFGTAVRLTGSITDITERKKAEARLLHDAFHDSLTGLPNRALFMDRLNQAIERKKRHPEYGFAVLFLDLDRFKDVNDSLGHMIGDQLLLEAGVLIKSGLRAIDTLARFGGDEFIILLEDTTDESSAYRVTNWIKEQFRNSFQILGHEVYTSTSIGIVLSHDVYEDAEEIIRDADIAMYVAKARGRARAEIFQPAMRQGVRQRLALETALRKAIENEELRVLYQPIVDLDTGKLIGFEALVRWMHPEKGLQKPANFVALAEETGMIMAIDRWMLQKACRQIQAWNQDFKIKPDLTISVNISGKHIADKSLREYVAVVLEETNLDPENLKLEITEFSIVDHNEITAEAFDNLKDLGVQIQIDDFGIGYSSLGYLSHFPINALKIDQSFIGSIVEDSSQRDIVQAIVMLTDRLNVKVIAEGVETQEQLDQLRVLGCQLGQGYLLSSPLDKLTVEELLGKIVAGNGAFPPWKETT